MWLISKVQLMVITTLLPAVYFILFFIRLDNYVRLQLNCDLNNRWQKYVVHDNDHCPSLAGQRAYEAGSVEVHIFPDFSGGASQAVST